MRKAPAQQIDPETYEKFVRCIAELLALVMAKEFPPDVSAGRSNVIKLERRKS